MKETQYKVDQINEKLGHSLDVDQAWAEFNAPKDERTKYVWFIFFGGLFLVCGLLIAFIFSENDSSSISQQNQQSSLQKTKEETLSSSTSINTKIFNSSDEVSEEEIFSNKIIATKPESNKPIFEQKHSIQRVAKKNSNTRQRQKQETKLVQSTTKADIKARDQVSSLDVRSTQKRLAHFSVDSLEELTATTEGEITLANKNNLFPISKNDENFLDPISYCETLLNLIAFDKRRIELTKKNIVVLEDDSSSPTGRIKKRKQWDLTLLYSYGTPSRTLSGTDDGRISYLNQTENFLEVNTITGLVALKLNRQLAIETGLNYSVFRTVSHYENNFLGEPELLTDVVIEVRIKDGVREVIEGERLAQKNMTEKYTHYKRYFDLGIPVLLNGSLPVSGRLDLRIRAGLMVNFYSKLKNDIQHNLVSIDIENVEPSELSYRRSGGLRGLAQIEINHQMKNDISFNLGIGYRLDLTDRTTSSSVYKDRFREMYLSLGVAKSFR